MKILIGALISFALLVSSCNGREAESQSEPVLGPIRQVNSTGDIVLPLDAYEFHDQEDRMIGQAATLLMRQCGERFGVQVTMGPPDNPSEATLNARRYGIIDASEAQRSGYRPPSLGGQIQDKGDGAGWNPSQLERFVVVGKRGMAWSGEIPRDSAGRTLPDDGCAGEVDRTLGQPPPGVVEAQSLGNDSLDRAENDSRVVAAFRSWSSCMSRLGYSYRSPWEPNDFGWPSPTTTEEIATATADVACKKETNVAGILLTVETAYQLREIEEHAEELAAVKSWRDERVRKAADILAAS